MVLIMVLLESDLYSNPGLTVCGIPEPEYREVKLFEMDSKINYCFLLLNLGESQNTLKIRYHLVGGTGINCPTNADPALTRTELICYI